MNVSGDPAASTPLHLVDSLLAANRPDEAEQVLRRLAGHSAAAPDARASLAALLVAGGKFAEAAQLAEELLAAGPLPARLVTALADTLARAHRDEAADGALAAAIAAGDPALELRVSRARLAERRGRSDLALQHWQRVLALVPEHLETRLGIVRTLRAEGRYAEAEAACRLLATTTGKDPRPLAELARLARDAGEPVEAEHRWQAALLAHPGHATILVGLAQALTAQHRFAEARSLLVEHARANPNRAEPLAALVRTLLLEGDTAAARVHAQALVARDPRGLSPALLLGRVLEAAGELSAAAAHYARLVAEQPPASAPRLAAAELAASRGDPAGARDGYAGILARQPQQLEARLGLAAALAELGRAEEAEAAAGAAVALAPNQPRSHLQKAAVAESLGRIDAARLVLLEARSAMPHRVEPLVELARLALRHGYLDPAAEHAAALLAEHPRSLAARLQAADVAFARQETEAARQIVAALASELPEHREVQLRRARLDWHDGAVSRARRRVARAGALDPRLHGPLDPISRLDRHPLPPPTGEIRVFLVVRNEGTRLPWLLAYYRGLGATRFLILDNDSDDGTRDWLLAQGPDVHTFHTDGSFAASAAGMRWTNHLLDEHGSGAWCLTVDADEALVYPHCERLPLPGLTAYLDSLGAEALLAPMLDMYADAPLDAVTYVPGQSLIDAFPWFDASGYVRRDAAKFPYVRVLGGCRARVFYATATAGPVLQKVPLIRWTTDIKYTSSKHTALPCRLADISGALLHFKFLPDFAAQMQAEVARGQHYLGAAEQRIYLRRLQAGEALSLMGPVSCRYHDSQQLVALGLMQSSSRFDAHARAPA